MAWLLVPPRSLAAPGLAPNHPLHTYTLQQNFPLGTILHVHVLYTCTCTIYMYMYYIHVHVLYTCTMCTVCIHLRPVELFITRKLNMIWRWNLYQSTSLTKSQKALEAHGCKPWVTNLLIAPHTLGVLLHSGEKKVSAEIFCSFGQNRIFVR